MSPRHRPLLWSAIALLACLSVWLGLRHRAGTPENPGVALSPAAEKKAPALIVAASSARDAKEAAMTRAAAKLLANLRRQLEVREARPHEGLLTFKDADAYQRFLIRARAAGLTVTSQIDALRTARVHYDALTDLRDDMLKNASDYAEVGANFLMNPPRQPTKEERAAIDQAPFGNRALEFLGVTGDHSQWGRGTTIAILDSGVVSDATFGSGRLRALDLGFGTAPAADGGHGTSVASLAAGLSADAPGVSPGASLLSIRVTDASGTSDIFTVSQAILAAVDSGAKIINISLGGYGTGSTLDSAIAYAVANGALIVAAAGNDQAAQLTWPAADPRVVSVGAIDAASQQVLFSNSGPQLQMTAPGYGVQTAWLNGERVSVSGTSASAPLVAGAIAAVMSENPGFTAQDAWQVLRQTANDTGAPGADQNYGNGILNLGWAMNRNNPGYIDTAVSSHYYDAENQQMDFVIQNRSGRPMDGLQLAVATGDVTTNYVVPALAAGASTVISQPVDPAALKAKGSLAFTTQLTNPGGVIDQVPANNRKSSLLAPAK